MCLDLGSQPEEVARGPLAAALVSLLFTGVAGQARTPERPSKRQLARAGPYDCFCEPFRDFTGMITQLGRICIIGRLRGRAKGHGILVARAVVCACSRGRRGSSDTS